MNRRLTMMLTVGVAFCLSPAMAGPPYNVDDPATNAKGEVRLTTAFTSSESKGKETYSFPNFTTLYGITDNLQLKIQLGGKTMRSAKKVESGLDDSIINLKWRFLNETKNVPQIALSVQSKLPTADFSRGLGTGRTDYKLGGTIAKSFGRFKLAANVGQNIMGDVKSRDNGYYGLLGTYLLTPKLTVGAQWYGNASSAAKKREEMAWGLGMRYNYAPGRALLCALGRSERGYSNLNSYVGIQMSFK